MIEPMENAFLSERLGRAIFSIGGRPMVLCAEDEEPWECSAHEMVLMRQTDPAMRPLPAEDCDIPRLRARLTAIDRRRRALSWLISGMDPMLTDPTRREAIRLAEQALSDRDVHRHVQARLLGRPLPAEADLLGAMHLTPRGKHMAALGIYGWLARARKAIGQFHWSWAEAVAVLKLRPEDAESVLWEMVDKGVVAAMIRSIMTGDRDGVNVAASQSFPAFQLLAHVANALLPQIRDDEGKDTSRPAGTIKWFNSTKGYGFIAPEDGTVDVFVHIKAVECSEIKGQERTPVRGRGVDKTTAASDIKKAGRDPT